MGAVPLAPSAALALAAATAFAAAFARGPCESTASASARASAPSAALTTTILESHRSMARFTRVAPRQSSCSSRRVDTARLPHPSQKNGSAVAVGRPGCPGRCAHVRHGPSARAQRVRPRPTCARCPVCSRVGRGGGGDRFRGSGRAHRRPRSGFWLRDTLPGPNPARAGTRAQAGRAPSHAMPMGGGRGSPPRAGGNPPREPQGRTELVKVGKDPPPPRAQVLGVAVERARRMRRSSASVPAALHAQTLVACAWATVARRTPAPPPQPVGTPRCA